MRFVYLKDCVFTVNLTPLERIPAPKTEYSSSRTSVMQNGAELISYRLLSILLMSMMLLSRLRRYCEAWSICAR